MAISLSIKDTPVHIGDLVRVHQRILEAENKERVQIFEGLVIKIRGRGDSKTFTVRKTGANNIGVEKIFPVNSPWIAKMEVKKTGHVRRAKLYYIREKSARQIATITQQA